MNIDRDKLIQVITDSGLGIYEEGVRLAEAWLDKLPDFPDTQWNTVGVEVPWFHWVDEKTLVVGVMDRLWSDEAGVGGQEHKSKGEPQKRKDGQYYEGQRETDWLAEITTGIQLRTYAMALARGTFVLPEGNRKFNVEKPRILVRAALKSTPVVFWPTDPMSGLFEFHPDYIEATEAAYYNAGRAVRGMDRSKPLAIPGLHCWSKYRRLCAYHDSICAKGLHPSDPRVTVFDEHDPGFAAVKHSGADLSDPSLFIFSASSYATYGGCTEAYHILSGGYAPKEEDINLLNGQCMHTALAEIYRQLAAGATNP